MTVGTNRIYPLSEYGAPATDPHIIDLVNLFTADENQEFYAVETFTNSNSVAGEQCEIGLYNLTSLSAPYTGASLIASATVTSTGAKQRIVVNFGSPVAVVPGNLYGVAFRAIDNGTTSVFNTYRSDFLTGVGVQSTSTGAVALDSSFAGDAVIGRRLIGAVLVRNSSALSGGVTETTAALGDTINMTSTMETITERALIDAQGNEVILSGDFDTATIPALGDNTQSALIGSVTFRARGT